MKKIKLEVGEIYQKKGTLDVRTVSYLNTDSGRVTYYTWGGVEERIQRKNFVAWLRRNEIEKPIAICDFKTGKARVVK